MLAVATARSSGRSGGLGSCASAYARRVGRGGSAVRPRYDGALNRRVACLLAFLTSCATGCGSGGARPSADASTPNLDLTGQWHMVCCDSKYTAEVTFLQTGTSISGSFSVNDGTGGTFTGSVVGYAVTFTRTFENGTEVFTLTLSQDGNTMTGSLSGVHDPLVDTLVTMTRGSAVTSGAGGAAGTNSPSGTIGSTNTGGASGASTGANAGTDASSGSCSPCAIAFGNGLVSCGGKVNPADVPSVTSCVSQYSTVQNADGTTTTSTNECLSNGVKILQASTTASQTATGSSGSWTGSVVFNVTTCYSVRSTCSVDTTAGYSLMNTVVYLDGSGHEIATVTQESGGDGGTTVTMTLTCPGQPPEPYKLCIQGPPVVSMNVPAGIICSDGTCM